MRGSLRMCLRICVSQTSNRRPAGSLGEIEVDRYVSRHYCDGCLRHIAVRRRPHDRYTRDQPVQRIASVGVGPDPATYVDAAKTRYFRATDWEMGYTACREQSVLLRLRIRRCIETRQRLFTQLHRSAP
jgi:hypothetical protein